MSDDERHVDASGDRGVYVLGNDDDRPIYVHLGELYPTSRTRQILMRDARCSDPGGAHRVTCSRDVLRSLIATQRMGLLLCKGGVSECELRAEMQRDCVDVAPFSLHNDAYVTMAQKCEQLAIAIADWGRLRGSMKATLAGGQADYACGPTFCFLRLACKPRYALNAGRVAREYIYYFFMLLFRTCSLSATDISTRTPDDALIWLAGLKPDVLERTIRVIDEHPMGAFWFVELDTRLHMAYDERVTRLARRVVELTAATREFEVPEDHLAWCRRITKTLGHYHGKALDPATAFAAHPGVQAERLLLQDALQRHGLDIAAWDDGGVRASAPPPLPLIFPTPWVGGSSSAIKGPVLWVRLT